MNRQHDRNRNDQAYDHKRNCQNDDYVVLNEIRDGIADVGIRVTVHRVGHVRLVNQGNTAFKQRVHDVVALLYADTIVDRFIQCQAVEHIVFMMCKKVVRTSAAEKGTGRFSLLYRFQTLLLRIRKINLTVWIVCGHIVSLEGTAVRKGDYPRGRFVIIAPINQMDTRLNQIIALDDSQLL